MKKLDVLGLKTTIKIKKSDDENAIAEWDHELNLITIDPEDTEKFHSLCHELAHVVWHRSGMHQAINNEQLEEMHSENWANVLNENFIKLYQMYTKLNNKRRK